MEHARWVWSGSDGCGLVVGVVNTIPILCRYDYKCVIYGWDVNCQMSDQWIQQMGVNQLQCGPTQPFYNVLVEDGTNRYAAQGNHTH